MPNDALSAMRQSIIDGAPDTASSLAEQALAAGMAPIDAINNGYVPGMHDVGEQFARGQMFLPDMMASAEAMRAAMSVLDPELRRLGTERPMAGVVILGTTKGDIHEIGKVLVGTLLTAHGFQVHDLGVDVAGEKFAAKARELRADIVGVSALLTTARNSARHTPPWGTASGAIRGLPGHTGAYVSLWSAGGDLARAVPAIRLVRFTRAASSPRQSAQVWA